MSTYHILNGDCLAEQLKQTKVNHDFIVCRECLIEGPLNAEKSDEFRKFTIIVKAMTEGRHLLRDGFIELLEIAFSMNGNGRYRRLSYSEIISDLESSETIRRTRSWQTVKI